MSIASDRLQRYLEAEQQILLGAEVRMDLGNGTYRHLRMADLEQVRLAINELRAQVAAESAQAAGAPRVGGLAFSVARLDGR